ncbi:MAG: PAS domain S-box protein [Gammaproteobacteria bacterium]
MQPDTLAKPSGAKPADRGRIRVVVLGYAVFAVGWMLFSGKWIPFIFSDPERIILASIFKDWLFVGITSLLLYWLMQRRVGADSKPKAAAAYSRPAYLFFVLTAMGILSLSAASIVHNFPNSKKQEAARLRAVADLKARQIADWLRERQGDADFVRTSFFFAEQYHGWQQSGHDRSGERLKNRLERFCRTQGLGAVMLLNPEGDRLWGSDQSPQRVAPSLQAAARLAGIEGKGRFVGPYLGMNGRLRLDFIAPLAEAPSPSPLVILHVDPEEWFYPTLQNWPAPSASGETLLFRRDADQVLYLNELRHQKETAAKLRLPLATEKLLAAQVLRGEAVPGEAIEGVDYRGIPALGVAYAVSGSDWFLIAKLDKSELYAEAFREADWIALTGLLALLMTGGGFHQLKQHQQLVITQAVQQSQADRLRAMNLLTAILESSDDAIFAKDLEGRYLLFNRAAADFVGKRADEVVGRDEHFLFPAEQAERLIAMGRKAIAENRIQIQEEMLTTPDGEKIFLASKGPLHDAENNIIGLFGISRDITERKHAERALQESEGRFRALVEQSLAGIFIIQDMRFRYVNPAFAAIFGYDAPEALIDRVPVTDLIGLEEREEVVENMRRLIESEVSAIRHYSFAALRRDGSRIDVETHGSGIDYRGRPAIIGLVLDISARKSSEEARRLQTEELKQRNAELERFNRATVGRELAMISLKQEVNALSHELGREPPYPLAFLTSPDEHPKPGDSE